MTIREPTPEDNASLCRLFSETPMGGRIQVCFDRSPDFFVSSKLQTDTPWTLCAFDDDSGEAIGCFSAGSRRMLVRGEPLDVRYLSDLRIHPKHRGGRLLFEGYRRLAALMAPGEWAQTLILNDNAKALALLTSKRAGLPHYEPIGTYVTSFLPTRQRAKPLASYRIRTATSEDIPEMQELCERCRGDYALAPAIDFERLPFGLALGDFLLAYEGRQLVCLAGLWNQSAWRRVRIHRYPPWLRFLRPAISAVSRVPFPKQGEAIPLNYLSALACLKTHPLALRDLILTSLLDLDPRSLLVAGFDVRDPLLRALEGLRQRRELGQHYLVAFAQPTDCPNQTFMVDPGRI